MNNLEWLYKNNEKAHYMICIFAQDFYDGSPYSLEDDAYEWLMAEHESCSKDQDQGENSADLL